MKWNDNRYRYSPEAITRRMDLNAQNAVNTVFGGEIVLSKEDIFNIFVCLRRVNRWELRKIRYSLSFVWKMAKLDNGHTMLTITEEYQNIIMNALIEGADTKEMYETLKFFMRWYGLKRAKLEKIDYDIPQDNRPGLYDDKIYDGTQWYEFVDQTCDNPEDSIEFQEEVYLKNQMEYA